MYGNYVEYKKKAARRTYCTMSGFFRSLRTKWTSVAESLLSHDRVNVRCIFLIQRKWREITLLGNTLPLDTPFGVVSNKVFA